MWSKHFNRYPYYRIQLPSPLPERRNNEDANAVTKEEETIDDADLADVILITTTHPT